MIKLYACTVTPGDHNRFHRATLEFKLDDEGLERLRRVLHIEFQHDISDLDPQHPALPQGPIEGEFIDD